LVVATFFVQNKKPYFCVIDNTMKRILPIILCAFYLFSSIGVAATVHLCGGKVANISLAISEEKSCCCGPFEATTRCCQNRVIAFEIPTGDYLPSKIGVEFNEFLPFVSIAQANSIVYKIQTPNHTTAVDWLAYLPPGKTIRIQQKSLLFYS